MNERGCFLSLALVIVEENCYDMDDIYADDINAGRSLAISFEGGFAVRQKWRFLP